jgi:hypothetical protein
MKSSIATAQRTTARRAASAALMICSLLSAVGNAAAAPGDLVGPAQDMPGVLPVRADLATATLASTSIYMRTAEIDTARTPAFTRDFARALQPVRGKRYLVQLNQAITPALRAELEASGIKLAEYLQVNAFIATIDPDAARAGALNNAKSVRFISAYQPQWKIDPEIGVRNYKTVERQALTQAGRVLVSVTLHQGEDLQPFIAEVAKLNAPMVYGSDDIAGNQTVALGIEKGDVAKLAQLDSVQFIEDGFENTDRSNFADNWIMQSNVGSPTPLFPLYANGLRGQGQILGHLDGSINTTHCSFRDTVAVGPTHRKVLNLNGTSGYNQHGTHTAATAVGWDPASPSTSDVQGIAPDGKLVHASTPSQTETTTPAALNLHYSQGARVHTNSWGDDSTNAYTGQCRGIDNHVYLNEDSLVVFAATNLGAIKTPENAKNCFAVNRSTWTPNGESICGTTCAGPTPDGRRKPEIMAPGCSLNSASGSGTVCTTAALTGTSMACPSVAGMAMLFREYFVDGYYPSGAPNATDGFNPSAALIKAAMMNSAVDMTGVAGWPGNQEGWGRVLADNALYFPGDARKLLVWDVRNAQGLTTGQQTEYTITVGAGQSFEATLVWTEPQAAINSNPSIVNNLDFEVVNPANTVYLGNVLTSGNSTTGGTADTRNNTEVVVFTAPTVGTYKLRVKGTAVNVGIQGYALVVTGDVSATPPPPPAPGRFALLTPADAETGVSLTPTFTWNPSANADTYTLIVASDSGLASVVHTAPGLVSTSYALPASILSNNTTYYWGVTANNVTGSTASTPGAQSFVTFAVPPACVGDLDGDNDVDTADLTSFLGQFGTSVTPGTGADFNGNGQVDTTDLTTFLGRFGQPC